MTKLARAELSFSNHPGAERMEFVWARVDDEYDYVSLCLTLPCLTMPGGRLADYRPIMNAVRTDRHTRPRTLARRKQVAEQAAAVVDHLGWTLTPAERRLIDRMAADRTRETR
jgi:hypothetical protein